MYHISIFIIGMLLYFWFEYWLLFPYKFIEAGLPGTTQDHLQIFNIEAKAKLKSHQMPEQVRVSYLLKALAHFIYCIMFYIIARF